MCVVLLPLCKLSLMNFSTIASHTRRQQGVLLLPDTHRQRERGTHTNKHTLNVL